VYNYIVATISAIIRDRIIAQDPSGCVSWMRVCIYYNMNGAGCAGTKYSFFHCIGPGKIESHPVYKLHVRESARVSIIFPIFAASLKLPDYGLLCRQLPRVIYLLEASIPWISFRNTVTCTNLGCNTRPTQDSDTSLSICLIRKKGTKRKNNLIVCAEEQNIVYKNICTRKFLWTTIEFYWIEKRIIIVIFRSHAIEFA